ncbi:MAG: M28 family peptidase [bacterium]|nr:M28 family peptidase [bacterium]
MHNSGIQGRWVKALSCSVALAATLFGLRVLAADAPQFDPALAWDHLAVQCSFGARNPGSAGHQKCLEYMEGVLKKTGCTIQRQDFLGEDPESQKSYFLTNLIAKFWPNRSRRLLLCAHWDTRPRADQDPDSTNRKQPIIGANDGASGVAVLLEIARCLSLVDPGIGVDLVFFDGEDMGRETHIDEYCLGSQWYAQHLEYPLPEAAILLDMVGDADLRIPYEQNSHYYAPQLVDEVFKIAAKLGETAFDPRPGRPVYDDHIHLLEIGIPAVDLIDFEYRYWHTTADLPAKCNGSSLNSVGRVALAWIYQRGQ